MTLIIFLIVLLLLAGTLGYLYLRKVVLLQRPFNAPTIDYLTKLNRSHKRIVFAGDSNTHGNMSYNWTNDISLKLAKINAGVNGDLSSNLLHRLTEVIDCKPDYVCVLIGTNDVNAALNLNSKKRYIANKKINPSQKVDINSFRENLLEIIERLKNETEAKISLLSLPLMGEDLESEVNYLADDYSEIIRNIASEENVFFLDIRTVMKAYIQEHQQVKPPDFEKYYLVMLKSICLHFYFGFSFDKLSQMNGMLLSHDQLHQNSIAGKIIARQVSDWLENMKAF